LLRKQLWTDGNKMIPLSCLLAEQEVWNEGRCLSNLPYSTTLNTYYLLLGSNHWWTFCSCQGIP